MEKADQVQSPKKEIQQHWNEVAKSWYIPKDSLPAQEYDEAIQKELVAVIGNDAKKTLDVGTGANCRLGRSLAKLGFETTPWMSVKRCSLEQNGRVRKEI